MKVAILGTGKTGSKVKELLSNQDHISFNSKNRPTLEKLENCGLIISFLPGEEFKKIIEMLIESKTPVVTGSTGFIWPENINDKLIKHKLKWVQSDNFSMGMNLIFDMIHVLKKTSKIFHNYNFTLHETHHTKKKDIPSGTALMWQKWLEEPIDISSNRVGDAIGTHCLTLNTEHEKITLTHEALNRKVFAQGALWAGNELLNNSKIKFGLHSFNNLIHNQIWSN